MIRNRRMGTMGVAAVLLGLACGRPLDLPQEPDTTGNPLGEVAYVRKYLWEGLGRIDDLVLTGGLVLYGVEDSARVQCWFSDTVTPRLNPGRSIPPIVTVDGDTLRGPVRICEGANNTLWVAYRAPRPTIVQWDIAVVPPAKVDSGVVRDDSIQVFGGIAADPDSGYVYVADAGRSRIGKYAPSATGGRRIALLATQGNGDHFVQQPQGIFFFQDSLLVADTGKGWIQVLGADVPLSGRGQVTGPEDARLILQSPLDVWVDALGMFYVVDTGGGRTLQLDVQGAIEEIVTEFDTDPAPAPNTLAATAEEVWVVDPDGGRLSIYLINTATEELP